MTMIKMTIRIIILHKTNLKMHFKKLNVSLAGLKSSNISKIKKNNSKDWTFLSFRKIISTLN